MNVKNTKFYRRIFGSVLILSLLSIFLAGCNNYKDLDDFRVEFSEDHSRYYIRGISESGKEKEELVIPSTINNAPVVGLGSVYAPSYFSSPNLKKLFWSGGQELNNKRIIDACPELETVVFTSACPSDYRSFFLDSYVWVFYHDKKLIRIILLNEVKEWILEHEDLYYVPDYIIDSPSPNVYFNLNYSITSSDFSDEFKEEWFKAFYSKILNKENDELLRRINEDLIVYCEQKNYDIDMLQQLKSDEVVDFIFEFLSEHVYEELKTESNILNHENYTWIDYIEDGERIKTMPPEPTRDGHEFTGWYLDRKCTQKADFKSFVKDGKDTTFYAGWKQK